MAKCCSVEGCANPVIARGWCRAHYQRWWKRNREDVEVCLIEDCEEPASSRGWCIKHYNRWWRTGSPDIVRHRHDGNRIDRSERKTCETCGQQFTAKAGIGREQWKAQRFCGLSCANSARAQDQSHRRKSFRQSLSQQLVAAASWEAHRRRQDRADIKSAASMLVPAVDRLHAGPVCRSSARPRQRQFVQGWCSDCGESFVVIRGWWHGSTRCSDCTHRYWKMGDHRGRARRYGVEYQAFSREHIFERDGWRCQLCGVKVVRCVRGKINQRGATLDHIVPLSQGGGHTEDNVQCACWGCNVTKGAGAANDQLRLRV